jgi:hypothetical protein
LWISGVNWIHDDGNGDGDSNNGLKWELLTWLATSKRVTQMVYILMFLNEDYSKQVQKMAFSDEKTLPVGWMKNS